MRHSALTAVMPRMLKPVTVPLNRIQDHEMKVQLWGWVPLASIRILQRFGAEELG
jgi:hypothetical protein